VVFWGRLIPGIRPFVSLPAGIELMPQPAFLLWSGAGSLVWLTALTLAGQGLGAGWRHVVEGSEPLARFAQVVLAAVLLAAVVWLVGRARRRNGRR
jgi:membrane protein DedA with SNARE-associated domain